MQRQWIGLSLSGDSATVEPLPPPPSPGSPSYIESIDIEVGFLRRGHEIAEQFNADEMSRNFIKAFNGILFSAGEIAVFEFHGQNLKATIKSLMTVDLADPQRRGGSLQNTGILMEKTDVNFVKDPTSAIKIKSSSKK
jgi:vesicle-fusing ATPase